MMYLFIGFYIVSVICAIQFWRYYFHDFPVTVGDIIYCITITWVFGIICFLYQRLNIESLINTEVFKAKCKFPPCE